MVSHVDKECEIWLANKRKSLAAKQEYGAWLRSTPYNPGRTPYTTVPGMGDGFGGSDKNAQEFHSNPEPDRADMLTGVGEVQADPKGGNGMDFPQASHMEMKEIREDTPWPNDIYNAPNLEVNVSVPNLFSSHTKLPDFETQIQEIDMELGKFDHQNSELFPKTANIPHVSASPEKELEISLNVREATSQDPHPHVTELNDPSSTECMTLRRWKKLARDVPMQTDPLPLNIGAKRDRVEEKENQPELPSKKHQVSRVDVLNLSSVEAIQQPHRPQ